MSRWLWIGGLSLVVLLVLLVWGVIASVGLVTDRLPHWLANGKQIVAQPVQKAEEMLPGLKERVKALVPPELGQKVEEWVPGAALPRQDVGGEDIAGIPRFPGMVRVAFGVHEQKKSVTYKGETGFAEVIAFYAREMATLGFTKEVTAASPAEETHVYAKGNRRFAFKFVKTTRLGTELTEVEVREL
ncbi:MAG: hypothetical protein KJ958_10740 [Gammaproteobacteria bacterium]|nr:hypothetical protein [Gammaproteobacteria bacterium]MBU1979632.1 hypothetical protein [Gammaproteobacteria bacterium]